MHTHLLTIVAGEYPASSRVPGADGPSLRTMRRGVELVGCGTRRLRLDADTYLVTNGATTEASAHDGDASVSPLLIAFRRDTPAVPPFAFVETLLPRSGAVGHHLQQIEHALQAGPVDPMWWDERIVLLHGAVIDAEQLLQARAGTIESLKPATRRELLRRVLLASDFIQSNYERPITLDQIAAAARLSRFHLVRQFRRVHGLTPHDYLTAKRVAAALRLLSQTQLGLDDVAAHCGLGTRSSLFRQLRSRQGRSASALRGGEPRNMEPACSTFA